MAEIAAQPLIAALAPVDAGCIPFNYDTKIGNRLVDTEEKLLIIAELQSLYSEVKSWLFTLRESSSVHAQSTSTIAQRSGDVVSNSIPRADQEHSKRPSCAR